MDEKVAEVANLTLRLREMSGKVMWHQSHQDETTVELESQKKRAEAAEARAKDIELRGVNSFMCLLCLAWECSECLTVHKCRPLSQLTH